MPEQSPISPPYKTACLLKKHGMLDKASYSGVVVTETTNTTKNEDNCGYVTMETMNTTSKINISGLIAMEIANSTSNKNSNTDSQTNDTKDVITVEYLSLDDVNQREKPH